MLHFFHYVHLSPFTFYTAMFMVGIVSERYVSQCFVIYSVITLWLLIFYLLSTNKQIAYFISGLFATTGALCLQKYQSNWQHIASSVAGHNITVIGIITNRVPSLNSKHTVQYTLYVTKASEAILQNTYLALYVKNDKRLFNPGTKICIKNTLCSLAPPHFADYLMKEGLSATLYSSTKNIRILHDKKSLWNNLYTTRLALLKWSGRLLSSSTHALFSSLFLGYKWNEPVEEHRETFATFKFWGISHYIARSGLHLAILIMLWQYILSYIPLHWYSKQLCSIMCGLFYLACSWPSVSFVRALITFILCRLFFCLKEAIPYIHIIALCAFCMLIVNPTLLFFLDFQLSFGMTFALVWINNIPNLRKTLAK